MKWFTLLIFCFEHFRLPAQLNWSDSRSNQSISSSFVFYSQDNHQYLNPAAYTSQRQQLLLRINKLSTVSSLHQLALQVAVAKRAYHWQFQIEELGCSSSNFLKLEVALAFLVTKNTQFGFSMKHLVYRQMVPYPSVYLPSGAIGICTRFDSGLTLGIALKKIGLRPGFKGSFQPEMLLSSAFQLQPACQLLAECSLELNQVPQLKIGIREAFQDAELAYAIGLAPFSLTLEIGKSSSKQQVFRFSSSWQPSIGLSFQLVVLWKFVSPA
ncbi:MAG: hypothetical protein RLZZ301_1372 [Bacteroidota bacterium]